MPSLEGPADTAAAPSAPFPMGNLGSLKPGNGSGAERGSRRPAKRRPAGPARPKIAANDDAPSIGGLIYSLQQKPSKRPFQVAVACAATWCADRPRAANAAALMALARFRLVDVEVKECNGT